MNFTVTSQTRKRTAEAQSQSALSIRRRVTLSKKILVKKHRTEGPNAKKHPLRKRRCGICRKPNHNRRTCEKRVHVKVVRCSHCSSEEHFPMECPVRRQEHRIARRVRANQRMLRRIDFNKEEPQDLLKDLFESNFGKEYDIERLLGQGEFGAVLEVANDEGLHFALKVGLDEDELETHKKLQDAGVSVPRIHWSSDNAILMDIFPGTLRSEEKKYSEDVDSLKSDMKALVDVLQEIHAQDVVHGDLHDDNVYKAQDGSIGVCDFGMSEAIDLSDAATWKTSPMIDLIEVFYMTCDYDSKCLWTEVLHVISAFESRHQHRVLRIIQERMNCFPPYLQKFAHAILMYDYATDSIYDEIREALS